MQGSFPEIFVSIEATISILGKIFSGKNKENKKKVKNSNI